MKNQHVDYKTNGFVCSQMISFDIEDDRVKNIHFVGGCKGNTQGVGALAEGMEVTEVIKRLKGVQCRGNNSCPNELATALEQVVAKG